MYVCRADLIHRRPLPLPAARAGRAVAGAGRVATRPARPRSRPTVWPPRSATTWSQGAPLMSLAESTTVPQVCVPIDCSKAVLTQRPSSPKCIFNAAPPHINPKTGRGGTNSLGLCGPVCFPPSICTRPIASLLQRGAADIAESHFEPNRLEHTQYNNAQSRTWGVRIFRAQRRENDVLHMCSVTFHQIPLTTTTYS